jgi:hypothetical protein
MLGFNAAIQFSISTQFGQLDVEQVAEVAQNHGILTFEEVKTCLKVALLEA